MPFFPQTAYQCGPAALATVLGHAGRHRTPEALANAVYVEGLRGSLQAELLAATRRHGLIPYPLEADEDRLVAELAAGRPALVLQNLGLPRWPVWHYAVVVGYQAERDVYVLRSGTERRRLERRARFLERWARAGGWGYSVLPPGTVPATATPEDYVRALAPAERWLDPPARAAAHTAALARWPADPLVLFAAAAASAEAERWDEAEARYRQLLEHAPDHAAARNNLAQVLAARGCWRQAWAEAQHALLTVAPGPLETAVQATAAELAEHRAAPQPAACGG